VTDAARIELKAQGTQVVGVYAGYIDTEMAAQVAQAKTSPREVAERTLDGIRAGEDHVLVGTRAREVWQAMRTDPGQMAQQMQRLWDQRARSRTS
jgi:short-subunit dehydrogenase